MESVKIYEQLVQRYQPIIEQRVSDLAKVEVRLGEMKVKNMTDLVIDVALERFRFQMSPYSSSGIQNYYRELVERIVFGPDRELKKMWNQTNGLTLYRNHTVYISDEETKPERTHPATIDALAHCLWEKLGGKNVFALDWQKVDRTKLQSFLMEAEGFVAYSKRTWFLDFYPEDIKSEASREKRMTIGSLGFLGIWGLINQHGEGILLEIPASCKTYLGQ